MLVFIALSLLVVLGIAFYIRRSKQKEEVGVSLYDNKYLKEYLELSTDHTQLEQYKILSKANSYLIEKEEEIDRETKIIYSLFCARMVSATMWENLKKAKDELTLDKITIEAELGRFSKIDKVETERETNRAIDPIKTKLSYKPSKQEIDELYVRIKENSDLK